MKIWNLLEKGRFDSNIFPINCFILKGGVAVSVLHLFSGFVETGCNRLSLLIHRKETKSIINRFTILFRL